MPHIHTKSGEHDHTVSAYIMRIEDGQPKILLHFHKKLHKYMQFGGHIELDETPWQAIRHELLEESGYATSQLRLLQPSQRLRSLTGSVLHPVPIYHQTHLLEGEHYHTDIAYAFVTDQSPHSAAADHESTDFKLLTRQELLDLPKSETLESVRQPALFIFDTCLDNWEKVDPAIFD